MSGITLMLGIVLLAGLFALYFLPTLIAARRLHHNQVAIFALNFLAGWTLIGWIAAIVWALTNRVDDQTRNQPAAGAPAATNPFSLEGKTRNASWPIWLLVLALSGLAFSAFLVVGPLRSIFTGFEQETVHRSSSTALAPPSAPPLALLSRRAYVSDGGGYFIVEGQVRNASSEPIRSLFAVAEVYDTDGTFITSDDGLVEYDPLLPGQASPFKVMVRYNPAMEKFNVTFKKALGGVIAHELVESGK